MLKKVKSIWKNDFFRGGAFYTASAFLINFLNYLFSFISARILGPRGFSEITSLFSYLSITAIPTLVVSSFIIQKVASSGKNKFNYALALEELFWRKIKNFWFIPFALVIFSPFVAKFTNLSPLTGALVLPLIILTFISTFYGAALQGLNLLIIFSLLGIFGTILKLLGPVLVLLGVDGFLTIIIFIMLSSLLPLLTTLISFHSFFRKKITQPLAKIEKKIRSLIFNSQFILILASTLALNLLNNFDIVFVKKFFSSEEAGIYSSWSLFAKIIFYGIGPLISVSYIFFSSQKRKNQNVFKISLLFLLVVSIISYFIYTNFSSLVINIFFGEKFKSVMPYLGRAAIFGGLYGMIAFINNYYLAKKSKISLIVPLLIPVYLLLIFLVKRDIGNIISLNIIFAITALFLHLGVYFKEELNPNSKTP